MERQVAGPLPGWVPEGARRYLAHTVAGQAIRDLVSKRNLSREKMSDAARAKLVDALQDDIVLLQGLLKKDLSYWLE